MMKAFIISGVYLLILVLFHSLYFVNKVVHANLVAGSKSSSACRVVAFFISKHRVRKMLRRCAPRGASLLFTCTQVLDTLIVKTNIKVRNAFSMGVC